MRKQINEIYILVHPFYNLNGDYWKSVCEDFMSLWQKSVSEAGNRENVYGILVESIAPNIPEDYVQLIKAHFKESFHWTRRSIVKNINGSPVKLCKPRLFWSINLQRVSARGVYVNQCVQKSLVEVLNQFSVPIDKADIDFYESNTGCLPEGFTTLETKFQHEATTAKIILPDSRLPLETNRRYTEQLLTSQDSK